MKFNHRDTETLSYFKFLILCISVPLWFLLIACSVHRVETSKSLYLHAQEAQNTGQEIEALLYWKKLREQTDREIRAGRYLATNYLLHATACFELGEWDQGFESLRGIHLEDLRSEELWIYPLYSVLLGDYYSHQNLNFVAENFYQSVLKKSTWKSSPIYLLALERHINNTIKMIEAQAAKEKDPQKFRNKEYDDLSKEALKSVEDFPFSGVPHFLFGDLLLKQTRYEEGLQQFLAALELGLPSHDLIQSTEFEITEVVSQQQISPDLKSALLKRATKWWGSGGSLLQAGENTVQSIVNQKIALPDNMNEDQQARIRYLAVSKEGQLKILIWERL